MKLVSWLFIGLQLLILATALDGARRCFKPPVTTPTSTPSPTPTTDPNDDDSSETPPEIATDTTEESDATDSSDVTDSSDDTSATEPTDLPTTTTANSSDLPILTTSESPIVDADAMCKYHPGVHYLPHPYNCHKFIQCDEFGRGEIHTCPDNLYWNSEILTCDGTCA